MLSQLVLPIEVPRAHRDPISSATQALSVFSLAVTRPLRPETLVLMMSEDHRGIGLFAVNSGNDLGLLINDIVGRCAAENSARAIAIASVRPNWQSRSDCAIEWTTASDICERAGVQQVDWFIVGRSRVLRPRTFVHKSDAWLLKN